MPCWAAAQKMPSPPCVRPGITRRPTLPADFACSTTSRSARATPRRNTAWAAAPSLFYGSTHQYPLYPGTGSARERGIDNNVANVPLGPNSGSEEFRMAWGERILPELDRFAPELLIVSAGFDAHRRDPLAQLRLETEDFAWITDELLAIARRHAAGRLVSALEGGYDLAALAASTAAHVNALMRA